MRVRGRVHNEYADARALSHLPSSPLPRVTGGTSYSGAVVSWNSARIVASTQALMFKARVRIRGDHRVLRYQTARTEE